MLDSAHDVHATAIRQFLETTVLFSNSSAIGDDESLIESGVLDSTGVLEVISFLEERYSLRFDDGELIAANFDSIARICRLLTHKME